MANAKSFEKIRETISEEKSGESNISFEQRIANEVSTQLESINIADLVADYVKKGIDSSLENLFNYNGACRNIIHEKLKSTMVPVLEEYDFEQHLVKMDTVLTELIGQMSLCENKNILENFENMMTPVPEKKALLSELFKEYCNVVKHSVDVSQLEPDYESDDMSNPQYMPVHASLAIEYDAYGYSNSKRCELRFSCEEDENLSVRIFLYSHEEKEGKETWVISSATREDLTMDIHSLRYANSFQIMIQKLASCFANISFDIEDCEYEIVPEETPEWSLT